MYCESHNVNLKHIFERFQRKFLPFDMVFKKQPIKLSNKIAYVKKNYTRKK